jgi:hypothetical protein
VTILHCKVEE